MKGRGRPRPTSLFESSSAGYPHGLTGQNIPIEGRIIGTVDVFDALTSKTCPVDVASDIMQKDRGRHFDPELLDIFLEKLTAVF